MSTTPIIRKKSKPKSQGELLRFVEDLKRQWMSTIDALVDPLMIVEKDYSIRKANVAMARMAGLNVKEVLGRKCHEIFAGRATPCNGCQLQQAAMKTENTTFDLDGVRTDKFYEASSHPLFDSDGNFDGMVQVYRDRTHAKRLQDQLSQQEKLASIGLLAGGVAHEINNPLGGILIFSQMLLRELDKESPHYPDVVEIEAATQRCKEIVEGLLDFARQHPVGSKKGDVAPVNVIDAVRTAMRFGKVSNQGGHVDITEDLGDAEHFVKGDRNRMIQLFLNLIQNALQAMPDGGMLIIRARTRLPKAKGRNAGKAKAKTKVAAPDQSQNSDQEAADDDGAWAVYEVEDTGVGIPPENLNKVFDPFFTTKDPGEGTGLGLALCYGIVQDLGGRMSVESTINVGTRFFIELPLSTDARAERPAS